MTCASYGCDSFVLPARGGLDTGKLDLEEEARCLVRRTLHALPKEPPVDESHREEGAMVTPSMSPTPEHFTPMQSMVSNGRYSR